MKWIGQHIYDLISRFRSDVYLEDLSTTTETSVLVVDSTGKVSKSTSLADDIIEAEIDTLAGLTAFGTNGVNTVFSGNSLQLINTTASSATQGGKLNLTSNDGAALGDDHRLGIVNFIAAEDASSTLQAGASIAAYADAAWSSTENGTRLLFRTMDGDATGQDVLTLDSDKLASFAGNIGINGDTITASGDLAIVATGNDISVDTDNFVISSSTSQKPFLELKNTTNDNRGGTLQFTKDKGAAGVDGDTIGKIVFVGDDRAQQQTSFAQIKAQVSEADDSDEAGKLILSVAESSGTATQLTAGLVLEGEHATDGEVDVTIAAGAASTTTIAGTLTMGSTATINNSGVVQVAAQTVIDHDQLANFTAGEHFTQANITTVGTIGTGVWQGTTIKTAYIGDDQVTEDKLADTLLAEIDANTAKVTNVATNLTATTHASQITINSSDGDDVIIAEASGSIAGVMSVTHHDKLDAIEASATADQSKSDIDGLAITTVGTIDTGVWNGTAIATNQQKHLMHYIFRGYAEGDGSTYEIPVVAHDNKSPHLHNISTGADGTTAITVQNQIRTVGQVMPKAGTLKTWVGWATGENTSGTTNIALFKVTPANDSNSTVSPILLKEIAFDAGGNSRSFAIAETSFSVDVAAGDVVFTGIKGISAKDVYFTSTLEIEF